MSALTRKCYNCLFNEVLQKDEGACADCCGLNEWMPVCYKRFSGAPVKLCKALGYLVCCSNECEVK